MGRIWMVRPCSLEQESQRKTLSRRLNLHPLIAQLLVQREIIEEEEAKKFLFGTLSDLPNPFSLAGMEKAVARLMQAIEKREKILIFGDYDVDGITGSAQLQSFLQEIGGLAETLLPHRLHDGYGLTEKSVRKISTLKPDLLITVDNGTGAKEALAHFRGIGIETIVIDHHETPEERDGPPVVSLLNPKGDQPTFKERNIASAGLVFLLLMALRSKCRERGVTPLPNLKRYLDLACLGTIADIVPLTGTNRLLVKYGLEEIGQTTRPGIKALAQVSSVRAPVGVGAVAFRLAPRINAAGRLADPRLALELLLSKEESIAGELASKLEALNRDRQQIEETVLREAIQMIEKDPGLKERFGLVAADRGWHLGVVGIVASKLTERFGRPAVVLTLSEDGMEAKGSARTVPGFSVYKALKKIEGEMVRFGGHDAAAGMSLKASNLEQFSRKFDQSVREEWPAEWLVSGRSPNLFVDASLLLNDINNALVQELSLLEPHGLGNPEPLLSSSVRLENCRIVGRSHLKATLCQGGNRLDAIGFNWGNYLETSLKTPLHQVAFSPQFNDWNGERTVQIKIKHIEPSI